MKPAFLCLHIRSSSYFALLTGPSFCVHFIFRNKTQSCIILFYHPTKPIATKIWPGSDKIYINFYSVFHKTFIKQQQYSGITSKKYRPGIRGGIGCRVCCAVGGNSVSPSTGRTRERPQPSPSSQKQKLRQQMLPQPFFCAIEASVHSIIRGMYGVTIQAGLLAHASPAVHRLLRVLSSNDRFSPMCTVSTLTVAVPLGIFTRFTILCRPWTVPAALESTLFTLHSIRFFSRCQSVFFEILSGVLPGCAGLHLLQTCLA